MTATQGHGDLTTGRPAFKAHRQGVAALALRLGGATYAETAEALGFQDAETARIAVESELANQALDPERKEILRAEDATRLERLLRAVWQRSLDRDDPEQLAAARVALAVIDRHIRLLGLDAPAEVMIHTPSQHEIDAWVAEMTARAVIVDVVEANIVEPAALLAPQ